MTKLYRVLVTTEQDTLIARQVIVTIPLGVLKANHKKLFTPNLDSEKVKTIENVGFGNVAKLFLEWDQPWWSEYQMIVTSMCNIQKRSKTNFYQRLE